MSDIDNNDNNNNNDANESEDESINIDSDEFDESEFDEEDVDFDKLPPFANEENERLHQLIKEKEEYLLKLTENVNETKNRISIMSEHMKNVENELSHSRQILLAKNKKTKTEEHMSLLAEKKK
eukprot:417829_1